MPQLWLIRLARRYLVSEDERFGRGKDIRDESDNHKRGPCSSPEPAAETNTEIHSRCGYVYGAAEEIHRMGIDGSR